MYAVIETGGKQYRVSEGDIVFLERLAGEPDTAISFDKVLLCSGDGDASFGSPYLKGARVDAKIVSHGKDKKVIIFKHKAKKGYRRKKGHRQPYTKVQITGVVAAKA